MAEITDSSTVGFTLELGYDEGLIEGDFVAVPGPDDGEYVAQITHTESTTDGVKADVSVLGTFPDLPFKQGTAVRKAGREQVLRVLRLPDEGLYVGRLRDFDVAAAVTVEDAMGKQMGVFGKTDSGKSYTAGVLVEELVRFGQPVIVIDPHGEYASLKVRPDGSASDIPVVEYADTDLHADADADLDLSTLDPASLVRPGQATVVNLRGMGSERSLTVTKQVLEDVHLARMRDEIPPTKYVVEEAHRFAPRRKNKVRPVIADIAKEGRKFGSTLLLISQRPSEVKSTVRAQIQAPIVHKLTDDSDLDKITSSVEGLSTSWGTQIQKLATGEALLAGDLVASPTFITVRERRTIHHGGSAGMFRLADYGNPAEIVARQEELRAGALRATVEDLRTRLTQAQEHESRASAGGLLKGFIRRDS